MGISSPSLRRLSSNTKEGCEDSSIKRNSSTARDVYRGHDVPSALEAPRGAGRRRGRTRRAQDDKQAAAPVRVSEGPQHHEFKGKGRNKSVIAPQQQRLGLTGSEVESTCDTGSGSGKSGSKQRSFRREDESLTKNHHLEKAVTDLLKALPKEAQSHEVLENTPRRVSEALTLFTRGYVSTVYDVIGDALFPADPAMGFVTVRDLDVSSMCEHHLLPFTGKCHIAYLPDEHILGLSKFARVIEIFARRLQMQERLTEQIAGGLEEALSPKGVMVVIECTHACMSTRGVGCKGARTITRAHRGQFQRDASLRNEALSHLMLGC